MVWGQELFFDATKVPANAAFRHAEGWAVFVVDDDVARLRPVELGKRSGVELQIAAGLEKGERVVTHPSDRVADGGGLLWGRQIVEILPALGVFLAT